MSVVVGNFFYIVGFVLILIVASVVGWFIGKQFDDGEGDNNNNHSYAILGAIISAVIISGIIFGVVFFMRGGKIVSSSGAAAPLLSPRKTSPIEFPSKQEIDQIRKELAFLGL